jgi:hypothetical protein
MLRATFCAMIAHLTLAGISARAAPMNPQSANRPMMSIAFCMGRQLTGRMGSSKPCTASNKGTFPLTTG